jgi:glycerophosphoryl diester phosphodiesterase
VPDFELPGVIEVAAELRTRHVSIGKNPRRTWASTRDDLVVAVRAREAGLLDWVLVWTANDERVLRELGRLAIDAVLTDDVAYARRILDAEHGRHLALLRRREQARIRIPSDRVR